MGNCWFKRFKIVCSLPCRRQMWTQSNILDMINIMENNFHEFPYTIEIHIQNNISRKL